MREELFIGGGNDGDRIGVPDDRNIVTMPRAGMVNDCLSVEYSHETYHRVAIKGHKNLFDVFMLEGLGGDDVMRLLIQHYRPQVESFTER